jgi:hypothetical protein
MNIRNHLKNNPFPLILLLIAVLSFSCEKAKEIVAQQSEDLVITLMTSGRWVVDQFSVSGTDVKLEFDGYEFQFLRDGTVEAIKGTTVVKGTWKANQTNMTIESSFPTGNDTLKRLNYIWYITKSGFTYVEAKVMEPNYIANMKLVKK